MLEITVGRDYQSQRSKPLRTQVSPCNDQRECGLFQHIVCLDNVTPVNWPVGEFRHTSGLKLSCRQVNILSCTYDQEVAASTIFTTAISVLWSRAGFLPGALCNARFCTLGRSITTRRRHGARAIAGIADETGSRQAALLPDDREVPELPLESIRVCMNDLELHRPRQWEACRLALTVWKYLELDGFWCGRRESNPHCHQANGFSYQLRFAPPPWFEVCGLDYPFTLAVCLRCCPSSLYTFPSEVGLGSGLPYFRFFRV